MLLKWCSTVINENTKEICSNYSVYKQTATDCEKCLEIEIVGWLTVYVISQYILNKNDENVYVALNGRVGNT